MQLGGDATGGLLLATHSGIFQVNGGKVHPGSARDITILRADDNSVIRLTNWGTLVAGGTYETVGTGLIEIYNGILDDGFTVNPGLDVQVMNQFGGGVARIETSLINQGTIQINGGSSSSYPAVIELTGTTTLAIEPGVTLSGVGTVLGDLNNAGTLSIRENGSVTDIQGTYTQANTGTIVIDLSASGAARTVISGPANLEGSLRIVPINGFIPEAGSQFVVLTASAINGQFDGDILGPCSMSVDYSATEVTITINAPPAFPSFDADNRVTVLDMVTQMLDSGNCPGCDTDLDCNAFVDEEDIHMARGNWPAQQ